MGLTLLAWLLLLYLCSGKPGTSPASHSLAGLVVPRS
jgi:hypothetical protein